MLKDVLGRSLWLAGGSAIGRLLPLAVLFWSSAMLGPVDYNTVSTTFMWSTVASSLVATGISTVMTQKIARESDAASQLSILLAYYLALMVASTLFVACCLAFGERASVAMFADSVRPGLHLPAALAGWAWPQVFFFTAALNGTNKTTAAATVIAAGGAVQGAGMLLAAWMFGSGSIAITWGLAVGSTFAAAIAAGTAFGMLGARGAGAQWVRPDLSLLRGNRYPILLSTVASASVMPVGFLAGSFLAKAEDGTTELAEYYFLEQISQVLVYFPAIAGQALMPIVSRQLHAGSSAERIDIMRSSFRTIIRLLLIVSTLAAAIGVLVPFLINAADVPRLSSEAVWATRWMIYNALLTLPLTVLGAVVIGAGHINFGSMCNVLWGACVLSLTALLIQLGNTGFQASRVAASFIVLAVGLSFLLLNYRPSPTL